MSEKLTAKSNSRNKKKTANDGRRLKFRALLRKLTEQGAKSLQADLSPELSGDALNDFQEEVALLLSKINQ